MRPSRTACRLPANGVNQTAYKYLQQIYGTYIVGSKKPITIDFGKFVTHMGYEVIESSSNDHYSRGLLFSTTQSRLYHAGLRFSLILSRRLLAGTTANRQRLEQCSDDNGKPVPSACKLNWNSERDSGT